MFDVESFLSDRGILWKMGQGRKGSEVKIDCPVCGGRWKLWCSTNEERFFCHRCTWSPFSVTQLIKFLIGCNGFEADLLEFRHQKMDTRRSLEDSVHDVSIHSDIGMSADELCSSSGRSRDLLEGVFYEDGTEVPPLEFPPYYVPLGDSRIPSINNYATSRGFSFKLLVKHRFGGCPIGKYFGSLILPAHHDGELVFWQARDVLGRDYKEFPKYRTPLGYSPSGCLFNLDEAVSHDPVILCEGVFSALRTGKDAVASFGNKISPKQVQLLKERGVKRVVLCFDPDTWSVPKAMLDRGLKGINAPIVTAVSMLIPEFDEVRVVRLVDGDPDDLGRKAVRKLIEHASLVKNMSDVAGLMVN